MESELGRTPVAGGGVPGGGVSADQGDPGVADQARQKGAELSGQAQDKAQDLVSQARGQARDQIEQRSGQAAEQINQQASDLRTVGESLREQGKDGPAKAADRLAEYAEKVGGYLQDRSSDQLLHDAEDFGRRQPWAAVGAGMGLGFLASRFLKASSRDRYSSRSVASGSASPALASADSGRSFAEPRMAPGVGAAAPYRDTGY